MEKPLPCSLARRLTFRQLQVFEAIARLGNFTRAAEELFLTQPTVSMQIKKLEESVNAALFEQIGKKIFLTAEGRELFQYTRDILESLAHFEMRAADMRGLKTGCLRLAVVTTAKYYAPRVLGIFCQKYPDIEVSLKVTNRERLLDRLSENLDDLYIIGQPPNDKDNHFIPLTENHLVVIAPKNHALCRSKRPLLFEDIATESFIIREHGSGTRKAVENHFLKYNGKINIRMELGSNEAIKHAVASGLGLSILSRHSFSLGSKDMPFKELDVEGFPISWPWYIGHAVGKRLSVVAKTFLDFVCQESQIPSA